MNDPDTTDPKLLAHRLHHEKNLASRRGEITALQTRGLEVITSTFNTAGINLDTGPIGVDRAFPQTKTVWEAPDGVDDAWTSDA